MENQSCILCSGKELSPMKRYARAHLVSCNNCGLVFCKEIPSHAVLSNYYGNYPRFGELSPITIKRYNELLDKLEPFKKTKNLLDMGCSNGLFLECAQKKGWTVYGTEFADDCIELCAKKNIKVFKSDALTEEFYKLEFDVVTSFEVIEHINNPNQEIELVKKILRKGGAYYVTTPNFNALSRLILKEKWNVIEYPEHLSYYTPRTLNKLLLKHGFSVNFNITTGISLTRFNNSLAGKDITANKETKPVNDESLRNTIESNIVLMLIKKILNSLLNLFKIGDAMKALYVKS